MPANNKKISIFNRAFVLALACFAFAHTHAQTTPPVPSFAQLVPKEKLPTSLKYTGDFKWALVWSEQDSAFSKPKRQVLIASEAKHPTELRNDLYLVQYGFGNGRYGLVWTLKEYAPKLCRVELLEQTLQIIDLDGDGKYETSFAYKVVHPEPEPSLLKAMLYHKGEKIVIRGKIEEGWDGHAYEKSIVEEERLVMQRYLEKMWGQVVENREPFQDYILASGDGWMLMESRSIKGLRRKFYELYDHQVEKVALTDTLHTRLRNARAVYPTPRGNLLYVHDEGVGTIDAATGQGKILLELPATTEGISVAVWSSDSSRVALVVLDVDAYPKSTRLYVLSLDGAEEPFGYDVLVSHYGFDLWTIEPPVFADDSTVKVLEVPWDQKGEGSWREIGVKK